MTGIDPILRQAPVIPVLIIKHLAQAQAIAAALVAGGLPVIEVTLRTPEALEAIRLMSKVPGAVIGAGTVLNEGDLDASLAAGAQFIVSPGLTETLTRAALSRRAAFLPGVASASDVMRGLDLGLRHFKFFPAEANGGVKALKAISAPFGQCRFCPTGGITQESAPEWLKLQSVLCVGGSWLVSPDEPDVRSIHAKAAAASKLVPASR